MFKKTTSLVVLLSFFFTFIVPFPQVKADVLRLPAPGSMVDVSPAYIPVLMTGVTIHPDNPLLFDFIIDTGNSGLKSESYRLRDESEKLIRYFLATLAIPENDLWVNLSPYEKDRMIPEQFGQTEMGRDMLAQDYLLKQLTASMIYPEKDLGKEFWSKVYAEAKRLYNTTDIPVNTFNKVWILADKAKVYVNGNTAFVVGSHLKVMLDKDYVALENGGQKSSGEKMEVDGKKVDDVSSNIVREIVLPAIEKEVNEGKNFTSLRQIFNSMILATWYKKTLKEALLNQVYADKSKISGIGINDEMIKEKIYEQYLKAYEKGVYNYIKEDFDPSAQKTIPRKYFSGGALGIKATDVTQVEAGSGDADLAHFAEKGGKDGDLVRARTLIEDDAKIQSNQREIAQAGFVAGALHAPLNAESASAADFLKGGYNQAGYGVAAGAANDGSHAIGAEGNQGYYVDRTIVDGKSGRQVFLDTVDSMKSFFQRRAERNSRPLKVIIKTGIGGQHTPFQGIADVFEVIDAGSGKIIGEYELGKYWSDSIEEILQRYNAGWDQVALIPSSKSGSTDETMQIFVEIFRLLLEKIAGQKGFKGWAVADAVTEYLHEINFDANGNELPGKDLFRQFNFDTLVERVRSRDNRITAADVKAILGVVLGNMFFETTDRPADSRLSAFIRNSGLDKLLGEDAPGFGAMFDNVGGRWTGDLHMMTFLAYHDLDAAAYWQARYEGIQAVRNGTHDANRLGNLILDKDIKKIALVVPDQLFWFGKASEQNFNESIWQKGFANLRAVRASDWQHQAKNYSGPESLVINLSDMLIDENSQVFTLKPVNTGAGKEVLAQEFARLFTTIYGMTYTVGTRLIARALQARGFKAEDINVNDLNNEATQIFQQNLFLRQPFVELGKGLLQKFFEQVQARQQQWVSAGSKGASPLDEMVNGVVQQAQSTDARQLAAVIQAGLTEAKKENRTFVPFIYLEGKKFAQLRQELVNLGIEWVLQGTGDQHISWQQVLANPDNYLPLIISFVPNMENMIAGVPAIGFARGYLNNISPHMIRHFFAQFSYEALLSQNGKGSFITLMDTPDQRAGLIEAFKSSGPLADTPLDADEGTPADSTEAKTPAVSDSARAVLERDSTLKIASDADGIRNWQSPHGVPLAKILNSVIKEYDIRGYDGGDDERFPTQIDETLWRWFGRGLASVAFTSERHGQTVALQPGDFFVIAGDNGPSTGGLGTMQDQAGKTLPNVIQATSQGLMDAGVNVINLNVVGSGALYTTISDLIAVLKDNPARFRKELEDAGIRLTDAEFENLQRAKGGLYVTRSHVEVGTNGEKPNIDGITLYGDMLQAMKPYIENGIYREVDAEKRGKMINSEWVRETALSIYEQSIKTQFGGLRTQLDQVAALAQSAGQQAPQIILNFAGGSLAATRGADRQNYYVRLFRDVLGPHLKEIMRPESDSWNQNGGLADPTRPDAVALANPKANVIEKSRQNPSDIIINFDLDADRISILQNGQLFLGDEMFYPVIEYKLTLDQYAEIFRTQVPFYFDSRMKSEFAAKVRKHGGIALIHPKGHSKVKTSIDIAFRQLVERWAAENGKPATKEAFLADHPGFEIVQSEYSTHMFKTDKRGNAFDDAVGFSFSWLDAFSKIQIAKQKALSMAQYIQDDKNEQQNPLPDSKQLKEQRTSVASRTSVDGQVKNVPVTDEQKKALIYRMTDKVKAFFADHADEFEFIPSWEQYRGNNRPFTLVDVEGVFHLFINRPGLSGEIFWGWSNTSNKVAFGTQSPDAAVNKRLAEVAVKLLVESRAEMAAETDLNWIEIEDGETKAMSDLFGGLKAVEVEAAVTNKYTSSTVALESLRAVQADALGGIDLNASNMQFDIEGDTINIQLDEAMFSRFWRGDFSGAHPVILNIRPVPSVMPLLGLKEDNERLVQNLSTEKEVI